MSPISHLLVLGLVAIDLFFGGELVRRFGGRWATIAFEFALILGYLLIVLQLLPWRRDSDNGPFK
jgi:hypothetical protein